jgi:hypothetical protein
MSSNNTNTNEATATAKLSVSRMTTDQLVKVAHQVGEVVKAHPEFANRPEVQQAVTTWGTSADSVDQAAQDIKSLRLALSARLAEEIKARAALKRGTKKILAVIDEAAAGSAAAIKSWGFEVATRTSAPATHEAPTGLRALYTKELVLTVKWHAVRGSRGYLLQMTDATGQGFGPPIPCPKAMFLPVGLTPGQKVTFRVAVQRKNGLSAYSDELAVTVR